MAATTTTTAPKPTVSFLGEGTIELPKITFTRKAMKWMIALIDKHNEEVGFYCTVERDNYNFLIKDVFYPKHCLVSAATCEIDPTGMQQIMMYLIENGREDDLENLKAWGHSHVNMGISPSQQDDNQALELVRDNGDYLIRLIGNKQGLVGITFYDLEKNMKFMNLEFETEGPSDEEKQAQIDQIVSALQDDDLDKAITNANVISQPLTLYDTKYSEIAERVVEMKKTNLPARTYHPGSHNFYKNSQPNTPLTGGFIPKSQSSQTPSPTAATTTKAGTVPVKQASPASQSSVAEAKNVIATSPTDNLSTDVNSMYDELYGDLVTFA